MAEFPHILVVDRTPDTNLNHALGVKQTLFHRARKRCAVVKPRAEIIIARVAMGVDMHHTNGTILGDRAQNRQGYGVITPYSQRCGARLFYLGKKILNLFVRGHKLIRRFKKSIATIGYVHHIER